MSKKDKLIKKLKSRPKDFTYNEMKMLLEYFEYKETNKGKTSGSKTKFVHDNKAPILLHKPHPMNELQGYQIKQIKNILEREGLI